MHLALIVCCLGAAAPAQQVHHHLAIEAGREGVGVGRGCSGVKCAGTALAEHMEPCLNQQL